MNRGALYYLMVPILLLLARVQAAAAARLELGGVKPDLVLLALLAGTLVYGNRSGIVWAFIAGIGLDIFSGGPMGASSLALMGAALVAGLGHRTLSRFNLLVPLSAAALGTVTYSTIYLLIVAVLNAAGFFERTIPLLETFRYVVLPSILYNTALMFLFIPVMNRIPESQDL